MKLLPFLFSCVHSRVKLFLFGMNSRKRYSIFVCFIYGLEENNSKSAVYVMLSLSNDEFFHLYLYTQGQSKLRGVRSMSLGVQVAIERQGWMVRAEDKCYYCTCQRNNLLDVSND